MSLFLEDDPELALYGEDFAWPLRFDATGDIAVVRGRAALEAALENPILVREDELPHRPGYGTKLDDLQGGPSIDEEHALMRARLLASYDRDPRFERVDVTVLPDTEADAIIDVIGYPATGEPVTTTMSLVR